jgi:predicted helicase
MLTVAQSKRTRDGGIDLTAFIQSAADTRLKYLVQCKHNSISQKNIGINVIREFRTVVSDHHANQGLIFSSTNFSNVVRKEVAQRESIISLKDYCDIMNWITAY